MLVQFYQSLCAYSNLETITGGAHALPSNARGCRLFYNASCEFVLRELAEPPNGSFILVFVKIPRQTYQGLMIGFNGELPAKKVIWLPDHVGPCTGHFRFISMKLFE